MQFNFNLEIYKLLELILDNLLEEKIECEEYLKITFGGKIMRITLVLYLYNNTGYHWAP